eukprot:TRINITY_DN22661_c0_g1_i2.p1 TRINITY_DN22661_c0_g1~~TRINITY_DN22661_c0_g1_i2.p1  ORF type:complete len:266 (+),score=44.96 TRINITY_DN22661_c0_g1_i2:238-1035(+)
MCNCLQKLCAGLVRFNARWSNYIMFLAGVVVLGFGLRTATADRNLLSLSLVLLGGLTMLTAWFGIWLSQQPSRRPCCVSIYSLLLLLLVVPQLMGAVVVTRPGFIDTLVTQSCTKFELNVMARATGQPALNLTHGEEICTDPDTCSSTDGCICECDNKCRMCKQEVETSRHFVQEHAQICARLFIAFGTLELFAWISIQMLSRFDLESAEATNLETEMAERPARAPNKLLRAMKQKYGDRADFDDPLAGSGLLGSRDVEDEIFCI